MSRFIPEETIQEVLLRADIVEVLSEYVRLKKSGANYKGLCPFHREKTPSFTVSPGKGLFYCFGCQASGNVVRFLMQHENLTFPEAVRLLAARYGVRIPAGTSRRHQDGLQPFYNLHQAARAFFHHCLMRDPAGHQARVYCRQRQITGEVASRFMLGYAPASWDALSQEMQHQGFSEELLVQNGLAIAREPKGGIYDRFRNRLMFPIHDRFGRPVAFGGRYLEGVETRQGPKYLNSPETPLFHKSHTLYGFHLAKSAIRQQGRAIVVEGYTDVIACHRRGVTSVVGTLGTALTERHVAMLRGLAREVILVFDSDAAGGAATERGIGLLLEAGVRVRVVELPEGEDPDSFLRQQGRDAFLHRVEEAMSFLDYLLARAKRLHDLQTPAGRADCVSRILPLLRKVEDQVEQWGYVGLLAEKVGVPIEVLQRTRHFHADRKAGLTAKPNSIVERPFQPLSRVEYDLFSLLLHDHNLLERIRHRITPDDFQEPVFRTLYLRLLQVVSEGEQSIVSRLYTRADDDHQGQLLAKMVAEPVSSDAEVRRVALDDYVRRLRQRRVQKRLHQLTEALREAERRGDAAEQQRLLQAYVMLRKKGQSTSQAGRL